MVIYFSAFSQENIESYNLMPWPQKIETLGSKLLIKETFTISINKKDTRVYKSATKFIRRLSNRTGVFINEGFPIIKREEATVIINFKKTTDLNLDLDESYHLSFKGNSVYINSVTDIGVLRALETLLQLIDFNENGFYFKKAVINDFPRFKWRGLMIDAARHFQPINVIKRNLDAMASVKMNVFHWHLSDDQGFRIESKKYPNLHKLASDGDYYTQNQIKDIVNYANNLGIRVIPEIDVPGHASALLTAYPELGSKDKYDYKIERFSGVFDPTLNPSNPNVYIFLDNLFAEITPLFPDEYFHIGGDENEGKHWTQNSKIQKFKEKHSLKTNHDLQTYFNIKLEKILKKYGKKLMGWDEIMTPNMPKTAVIHSWRGKNEGFKNGTLIDAVKNGYQTVLSNDYYIDRMQSVKYHYLYDPIKNNVLTKEEQQRVLGGEVTMWSELVTPVTIDSRIWPRTAAIAERFWSSKNIVDVDNMLKRLKTVNLQLEELGITHIKNRDLILRNLTKGQEINSLIILTKIYEPLKIYSRNKGGTEYKTFSPMRLFADACSSDASDAMLFKKATDDYLKNKSKVSKKKIISLLKKWSRGYTEFSELKINPLLKNIHLFYNDLNTVSISLLNILQDKKNINIDYVLVNKSLSNLKKAMLDTELMIGDSLGKLFNSHVLND